VGLKAAELIVDGISVATATNLTSPAFLLNNSPAFSLNTANYADGAHTISVRATDYAGLVTTSNIPVKIDNTAPTSTGGWTTGYSVPIFGTASDNYSGVTSVTLIQSVLASSVPIPLAINSGGNWGVSVMPGSFSIDQIQINDAAGNCSVYKFVWTTSWVWTLMSVCP
jgi:hypothetical protein